MSRSSTPGSPAGRPAAPNGDRAHSYDYTDGPELDEVVLDQALVTTPGQGGVGVFQAPRPVPRRTPAPDPAPSTTDSADIDSPFLDLFGGTRPGGARPSAPAREPRPIPQQPTMGEPAAAPPARVEAPLPPPRQPVQPPEAARPAEPPRTPSAPLRVQTSQDLSTVGRSTAPEQVSRSALQPLPVEPTHPLDPDDDAYEAPAKALPRVPHQAGDRLPALNPPAADPGPVERPS
ncbi:hypothetical protein AB0I76_14155, partial [Micromonospora sp. NPDC049799]